MPHTHHSHSGQFCNHAKDTLADVLNTAISKGITTFGMTEHIPRSNKYAYPGELEAGYDSAAQEATFEAYVVEAKRLRADLEASQVSFSSDTSSNQQGLDVSKDNEKEQEKQSYAQRRQNQTNGPQEEVEDYSINREIPTPASASTVSAVARRGQIEVLIGLEGEWVDAEESPATIRRLMSSHSLDYFIGSIHHVRGIPIDFDRAQYELAMELIYRSSNSTATVAAASSSSSIPSSSSSSASMSTSAPTTVQQQTQLFLAYFQEQAEMLRALQPQVVGHFDLIRLFAVPAVSSWRAHASQQYGEQQQHDAVWQQILINLRLVRSYGGVLEINTSGLRKGLSEPYPRSEICREWIEMGGDFVLSDDSHGIDHLGTCYPQALQYIKKIGLRRLAYLSRRNATGQLQWEYISIEELEKHPFFQKISTV